MSSTNAITWNDEHEAWWVASYADVASILQDHRFSACSGRAATLPPEQVCPAHDPSVEGLRRHVTAAFHRCLPEVRNLMHSGATALLESLKRELSSRESIDLGMELLQPWCRQLSVEITGCQLAPAEEMSLHEAAQAVFHLGSNRPTAEDDPLTDEARRGTTILAAFFLHRLNDNQTDQKSALLHELLQEGTHSPAELVAPCVQLFVGVSSSLPLLLGNLIHHLYIHPDMATKFLQTPGRRTTLIHDFLSQVGTAQVVYRISRASVTVGDHTFKRGDRLALALCQANRDPKRDAEAPHLSLGGGSHACLGAPLILEACSIFPQRILEHFPLSSWSLDRESAQRGGHRTISGFSYLPLSRVES